MRDLHLLTPPSSPERSEEPLEDFRPWKVRPDILHAVQVVGSLLLVAVVAAVGFALHIALLRAFL